MKKYLPWIFVLLGTGFFVIGYAIRQTKQHTYHHPQAFISSLASTHTPGAKVYHAYCENCHAQNPLIPVGAPAFRDQAAWQYRSLKGKKAMFAIVDQGLNEMPPRGGCFECSDEVLQAAVEYMLPNPRDLNFTR